MITNVSSDMDNAKAWVTYIPLAPFPEQQHHH